MKTAGPRKVRINEIIDPVVDNENLQDLALDQVRFPRKLPLHALVAFCGTDHIDITDSVGAGGVLDWVAPEGDWKLYALFMGWHGKQVERAGPGGRGSCDRSFLFKGVDSLS